MIVLVSLGLHLAGCDTAEPGADSSAGGTTTDGGADSVADDTTGEVDTAPEEGFRVFPKYMLQDVQAVVTMVAEGMEDAVPCAADTLAAGGYLCDTGPLSPADEVTIRVERDGFEPAERDALIEAQTLEELEVHLSIEGGPTGLWSDCTLLDMFATCADICATADMACAPASCAVGEDSDALATARIFGDLDCVEGGELAEVQSCNAELPEATAEAAAVRCCCES